MGREPGRPLPASSSSSPWPDCPRCVVSVAPRSAHPSPTPLAPRRLLSVSVLVTPGFLHGVPTSHVRDIARGCPCSQKHPLPRRGARLASQRGHRLCPPPGAEAPGLQPLGRLTNPARLAPAGIGAPGTLSFKCCFYHYSGMKRPAGRETRAIGKPVRHSHCGAPVVPCGATWGRSGCGV